MRFLKISNISMVLFLVIFLNIGFSQTYPVTDENENSNLENVKSQTITDDYIEKRTMIAALIKTDNVSYVDPQDEKNRRKAMAMILKISKDNNPTTKKHSSSIFNLMSQKQKDREKGKRDMKAYNQRNNKKISNLFQQFQEKRYQSAVYSGKRYDYSSYIQNFLANTSR